MRYLKNKKTRCIALCALAGLILLVCAVYLGDYYRAEAAAFAPAANVTQCQSQEGYLVFAPAEAEAGFIFYPGGKVEHTAYIPLMNALAERGILSVLVQMPCHLAVLDMHAADGLQAQFPGIENWYIGGHSLGGAMAAAYVEKTAEPYMGLVLLGAYSTADLSESGLTVLSIYGSEDGVMDREKYETCKGNLPSDFTELEIQGGCHAGFGQYGAQEGDGVPTISHETQICRTADAVAEMICES